MNNTSRSLPGHPLGFTAMTFLSAWGNLQTFRLRSFEIKKKTKIVAML